eukprot:gb/GFBE01060150.1/.p1 GENE.gb/GFBE01060150.1/~~gb/GFBE01060150.1/.p1  ORF type:complete len:536 (+),score=95.37 gb/GFBE01060150.1/:1-1608(+)
MDKLSAIAVPSRPLPLLLCLGLATTSFQAVWALPVTKLISEDLGTRQSLHQEEDPATFLQLFLTESAANETAPKSSNQEVLKAIVAVRGAVGENSSLAPMFSFSTMRSFLPGIRTSREKSPENNSDENTPFAKVRTRSLPILPHDVNATAVDVEVATPQIIVSVYLLMYVPLGMAWAYFFHYGSQDKHYLALVPVTLCAFIIGLDLVNQSLSALMEAPMALTTIQASFMCVATGLWTLASHIYASFVGETAKHEDKEDEAASSSRVPHEMALYPLSCGIVLPTLCKWMPSALWFSAYQLVNHEVSYYCSLSERTVFMNLCPLVALFVEPLVLPSRVENLVHASFSSKMALITMAFGAVLFSLQYPDFTSDGVRSAVLLVAVVVPYRLLQRVLLVDCKQVPATFLCCFDGLLLIVPSAILTALNETKSYDYWHVWLHNPSIMLMLGLSLFASIGNHLAVLYLLKVSSATSSLVFTNLASFVVVFEGIFFFSDPVLKAPLVIIGIVFSLAGGLWYAVDQQPSPCLDCVQAPAAELKA